MEHLVKLLRDSYDLQEEKSEETAYWHLQKLRSEIKQLTLTDVSQQREPLSQYTEFLNWKLPVENEINLIEIDEFIEWLNCG